jgi:probable HAF family extracellular repeat protein
MMRTVMQGLIRSVASLCLCAAASGQLAHGLGPAPQYKLTILAPLPGYSNSDAADVNNAGLVAGVSYAHPAQTRATRWSSGLASGLPTAISGAASINALGQVAGSSVTGSGTQVHAAYYDGSVVHDIHTAALSPIGNFSVALSINDSAQIVGWAAAGGASDRSAILWNAGVPTLLGTLGGNESAAFALNNSGQVTGFSETPNQNNRAFRWTDLNSNNSSDAGEMVQLPDLGLSSVGNAINDLGQVAGWVLNGSFQRQPVVWNTPSAFSLLPLLSGATEGEPFSMNSSGVVVGKSTGGVATLWQDGQAYNLNNLIQPGSGVTLIGANAINDQGWIVGECIVPGVSARGFLLVPIPEPSSALLAAYGLLRLVAGSRRLAAAAHSLVR